MDFTSNKSLLIPCHMSLQDHESELKAIYTGSTFLESSAATDNVGLVLGSTSFYAEQGGQVIHFI